jgi:hypothetical protein
VSDAIYLTLSADQAYEVRRALEAQLQFTIHALQLPCVANATELQARGRQGCERLAEVIALLATKGCSP